MDAQVTLLEPQPDILGEDFDYTQLLAKAQKALAEGKEVRVAPGSIRPMPNQPRKHFNEEGLLRLAHSMKAIGQLQPGLIRSVQREGNIEYELLDGERRWRSASLINLQYRATLIEIDDVSLPLIIAAVANFNREGHTPTEVSDTVTRMARLRIPMEEIAKLLGISIHWAYQMQGLQKLRPEVWDMLDPTLPREKRIPVTAAIQISKVDQSLQVDLAERVLAKTLTLQNIRHAAVSTSKDAGLHIRERRREPRKQWDVIRGSLRKLLRTSQDLEAVLKETASEAALRGKPNTEVKTLIGMIEETRRTIRASENRIRTIRPQTD